MRRRREEGEGRGRGREGKERAKKREGKGKGKVVSVSSPDTAIQTQHLIPSKAAVVWNCTPVSRSSSRPSAAEVLTGFFTKSSAENKQQQRFQQTVISESYFKSTH